MKVKGYKIHNGRFIPNITEIPWYKYYYYSYWTIWNYYSNKIKEYIQDNY